jgi:hypothetical protein
MAMSTMAVSAPAALAEPATFSNDALSRTDARRELKYRILTLPLALLLARLLAGTPLRMAAAMLAMVLHESGHAITAWLTGRWAVPLLWVTPHGQERSWLIVLLVTAAILFGGFLAWKMERPGWLLAVGAVLVLQLIALSSPAEAMIVIFRGWRRPGAGHDLDGDLLRTPRKRAVQELGPALGIARHRGPELHARFPNVDGTFGKSSVRRD